jgi:hypothetical protein
MPWRQTKEDRLMLEMSARQAIEEVEAEEVVVEDAMEECLLKAVFKLGARAKIDIPMYEGNLDTEELLD